MKCIKIIKQLPVKVNKDFHIRGTAVCEEMNKGFVNRPNGSGDCFFVYLYDRAVFATEEGRREVEPKSFIVWTTGQSQYYGVGQKKWLHSWTLFSGKLAEKILKENSIPVNTPVRFEYPQIIESHLADIYDELVNYEKTDKVIAKNIFENMFRKICRRLRSNQAQKIPQDFLQLKSKLETEFSSPWNLEKMSDAVYLSVPHFCAEWKKHFKISPIKFLIELRLNHALYLLKDINLSVGDIATETGFTDIYYFSKLFKKNFGKSPSKMRDKI